MTTSIDTWLAERNLVTSLKCGSRLGNRGDPASRPNAIGPTTKTAARTSAALTRPPSVGWETLLFLTAGSPLGPPALERPSRQNARSPEGPATPPRRP